MINRGRYNIRERRSARTWLRHDDREKEHQQPIHLIHCELHFNFIKIYLLSHFSAHIRQVGNTPMDSTEFGELAPKEQMKDGWRRSNKNDGTRQIVHGKSLQHAIRMRSLNLESLQRCSADLSPDVLQHLESTTSAITRLVFCRRILKGRRYDVSNVLDFRKMSGVSLESICHELILYSRHRLPKEHQPPEDHAILQSLPVELLTQLKIPVVAFQASDVYYIHPA